MIVKRPASDLTKEYKKILYVANSVLPKSLRPERSHWKRDVEELLLNGAEDLIGLLKEDKLLPKWHTATCPRCGCGTLGELGRGPNNAGYLQHR